MIKYNFYTLSIKKFERDQLDEVEENQLMKEYWIKKLNLKRDISDEDLMKKVEISQKALLIQNDKYNELEEDEELFKEFEKKVDKFAPNKDEKESKSL